MDPIHPEVQPVATTASLESPGAARRSDPDRILLHGISWELYERLRDDEANWSVRMSYVDGDLELMSPSQSHSEMEWRLGCLLIEVCEILDRKCKPLGPTTWKNPGMKKAKEADGCFYLANYEKIRHKKINLTVDHPPDLAVKVEVSRSALDSLKIYAAIGVPEVWRFDGDVFRIHLLQPDGHYVEIDESLALPFLKPVEVLDWMRRAEDRDDDMEWKRQIREWARVELAPRLGRIEE
jgi:Uma2 family endonuclease